MVEHGSVFYIGGDYDTYVLCSDADLDNLEDLESRDLPALAKGLQTPRQTAVQSLQPFTLIAGDHGRLYMRVIYSSEDSVFSERADGRIDRIVVLSDAWITEKANSFHDRFPNGLGLDLLRSYRPVK